MVGTRVPPEVFSYVATVKEAFRDEPEKYHEFYKLMGDYTFHRVGFTSTLAKVKELMKDHKNLLLGLNAFLPPEAKITIPPDDANKEAELTSDDALSYVAAVEEAFHDEPAKFEEFCNLISDYRFHRIDVASTIARLDKLMKDHPNLVLGFLVFLPAEADQPTHSDELDFVMKVRKLKDVHQHEPAKYQEFKKLLNYYTARSFEQKYPRAYNLLTRVKERFQGEDSHVYKSFLQIMTMYREGNMSSDKMYHEILTLLQDHQDLVMEFSDLFKQ